MRGMQKTAAALVIIMGLAALVNAATRWALPDLIKQAQASGESVAPESEDVRAGYIPAGSRGRALEIDEKESADGATHDFIVYEKDGPPQTVLFSVISEKTRQREFLNFICDAKGRMNSCYRVTGDKDESGRPVRGSLKSFPLNRKGKETSALLQHELDFWLKGMYRKTASKPRP